MAENVFALRARVFKVSRLLTALHIGWSRSAQGAVLMGCSPAAKQDLACEKSGDKQQ